MQSVSSRIWTRVAVSISYDDNHYTTGTSKCEHIYQPTLYRDVQDATQSPFSANHRQFEYKFSFSLIGCFTKITEQFSPRAHEA